LHPAGFWIDREDSGQVKAPCGSSVKSIHRLRDRAVFGINTHDSFIVQEQP